MGWGYDNDDKQYTRQKKNVMLFRTGYEGGITINSLFIPCYSMHNMYSTIHMCQYLF